MSAVDGELRLTVAEGWYGFGTWLDDDDVLSPARAEAFIAESVEDLVNNGWPDEVAWPICLDHKDHPLQVGLVRGHASWYCSKDAAATTFRVGELRQ